MVAPAIFLTITGYFGWNATQGDRGLVAYAQRQELLRQVVADQGAAKAERDGWDTRVSGLRARHPWIESFNHHTWSHSLNLAKPEPAIYRHAVAGLNTPPANILFVDDKIENIDAALSAGMQAIQYTSHNEFEREMHSRGFDSLLRVSSS